MGYKENLIEAYGKLDKAVEIHLEEGGEIDDRPQLKAELLYRLKLLDQPPKAVTIQDGIKLYSDGKWFGEGYEEAVDEDGYVHVVKHGEGAYSKDWNNRLYYWMRRNFLDETIAVPRLGGLKRDTVHHLSENRKEDSLHNLLLIPSQWHLMFHCDYWKVSGLAKRVCEECAKRELEPVKELEQTVDARWLHGELGLATDFSNWVEQWGGKILFKSQLEKVSTGGRPRKDYTLSTEDALMIAMRTDTDGAVNVRKSLINKIKSAQKLAVHIGQSSESELELLKKRMNRVENMIPLLRESVDKIMLADSLLDGNDGLVAVQDVPNWINGIEDGNLMGRNAVIAYLKDLNYLQKKNSRPTSYSIKEGYIKSATHVDEITGKTVTRFYMTPQGLLRLLNKAIKDGVKTECTATVKELYRITDQLTGVIGGDRVSLIEHS